MNTGGAINNSLTVLLPPPSSNTSSGQPLPARHLSTLCLMLASSFFVSPLSTTMCVIVLDLSWWMGDLVWPCWLRTKQIYFMYVWAWAYAYSSIVFPFWFSGFFFFCWKGHWSFSEFHCSQHLCLVTRQWTHVIIKIKPHGRLLECKDRSPAAPEITQKGRMQESNQQDWILCCPVTRVKSLSNLNELISEWSQ